MTTEPIVNVSPDLISIVIPTLGRPSIYRTLESIRIAGLADVEIIVCMDAAAQMLDPQDVAPAKLFQSPGPGVNRARNAGARQSRGHVIWFLDDDTELFNRASIDMVRSIFRDTAVVAAGGEYIATKSSGLIGAGYNAFCSVWRASAGIENREQLLGGTLAVRRSAFEGAGGFDEHIEYGGAETSFVCRLNHRASNRDRIVFDQSLDVLHKPAVRSIKQWMFVATAQGIRKSENASALPPTFYRIRRALEVLRRQTLRTLICLAVFGLPFILISRLAVLLRR